MKLKKGAFIGIGIGLVTLSLLAFFINQFVKGTQAGNEAEIPNIDTTGYQVMDLYPQDPVTIDGTVQLVADNSYFYDAEKGQIDQILVQDGQQVKKGDLLYKYIQTGDLQHDIEDALREQTRLYNDRNRLIDNLSKQTGLLYNYQGDTLQGYWAKDGQYYYYVSELIGKSGQPLVSETPLDEEAYQSQVNSIQTAGQEDPAAAAKDQIRQVNQQIEDVEIKLQRLYEKQRGEVRAEYDGKVILNPDGKTSNSVPLVRIISQGVQIKGSVTEYEFYLLAKDIPVQIYINAEDRYVSGTLVRYDEIPPVSSAPNQQDSGNNASASESNLASGSSSTQFGFTVSPDEFIQPGFTVKIQITPTGLVLPQEAILEEDGHSYVFIYQEGIVHKKEVNLENQGLQRVVQSGLEEGQQVVLNPFDLKDGQKIEVMQLGGMDDDNQSGAMSPPSGF